MQTDTPTFPQAESSAVAELAARVSRLERSARRWRASFAALAVVVVSMGAAYAVNDGEFGTIRARKFEVVTEQGESVATLTSRVSDATKKDEGVLLVSGNDKRLATFIEPGIAPTILDRTK